MPDNLVQAQLNALMRPRMVCVCKRVPEERIRQAVADGAVSFEALQAETQCATGCGTCEGAVRDLLAKLQAPPAESNGRDTG